MIYKPPDGRFFIGAITSSSVIVSFMRLLLLFLMLPSLALAGEITFHLDGLPDFSDYSTSGSSNIVVAEDIDWNSHEMAWDFRTRLRAGLQAGPNFAGKFVVVTHGCGTSCQVNWIVDLETGRIVDQLRTSLGIEYRLDSHLIVTDMYVANMEGDVESLVCSYLADEVGYYVLENDDLLKIASLKLPCFKML